MSIAPFMWIPASLVGKGGGDNVDADKCRWRGGCAACDESECDNRDKSASDTEVEALRRRVAELERVARRVAWQIGDWSCSGDCEHRYCGEDCDGGSGCQADDPKSPHLDYCPCVMSRDLLAAANSADTSEPAPQPAAEVCRWRVDGDAYVSQCSPGSRFSPDLVLDTGDGEPMEPCPGCGRRVEVAG